MTQRLKAKREIQSQKNHNVCFKADPFINFCWNKMWSSPEIEDLDSLLKCSQHPSSLIQPSAPQLFNQLSRPKVQRWVRVLPFTFLKLLTATFSTSSSLFFHLFLLKCQASNLKRCSYALISIVRHNTNGHLFFPVNVLVVKWMPQINTNNWQTLNTVELHYYYYSVANTISLRPWRRGVTALWKTTF